ncbi:MAG: hypothetical protein OEU54_04350 [Gemmatimonadota bacterium]|nr:hypothetical protein [Gemmatimonadota bacterium]
MSGSRGKAVLTLALVFIAGAAVGIASDRLEVIPRAAVATPAETPGGAGGSGESQTIIEQFADDLGLSTEQRLEIGLLLDYYAASLKDLRTSVRPKYRALMDSVKNEIESVLDDQQRSDYRTLLQERYGQDDTSDDAGANEDRSDGDGDDN